MNVCDEIARHAARRPETAALIDGGRVISYRELDLAVRRTASHLLALGVRAGDRVGLCLKDNAEHFVALLAVARMGAVILPLDWRAKPDELRRLERKFAPRLVLVEDGAARSTEAFAATPTEALDDAWRAAVAAAPAPAPDDAAFADDGAADFVIALSSGTTGEPRGAIVTHDEYIARIARYVRNYGATLGVTAVSVTPLAFSAGRNKVFYLLFGGGTIVLYPTLFAPEEFVEQVARHRAGYAFVVPTVLRWLLKLPDTGAPLLPSLKVLSTGGAFISAAEKREVLRRISPNLHISYSSSATGQISLLRPAEMATHAESVGRANHLVDVEIVDGDGQKLPPGEVGRLRCRGSGIGARFYGEEPDGDARDGWIYTGELAMLDGDGYIFLKGRTSEIIIRDGINIYPEEIEQLLRAQAGVAEAAVVGKHSEAHGEEAVAFVVADGPLDPHDLLAACRRRLMSYKVPSEIVVVDSLPKTTAGKIRKKELAARL